MTNPRRGTLYEIIAHHYNEADDTETPLRITYRVTDPGAPAHIDYVNGGDPGWGAEFEIEDIEFKEGNNWRKALPGEFGVLEHYHEDMSVEAGL